MSEYLPNITDELACEITSLACGYSDSHEVIDRIYGIDVGICGKHNEINTVCFRIDDRGLIINYKDLNKQYANNYCTIKSKNTIRKKLMNIGFKKVLFNQK